MRRVRKKNFGRPDTVDFRDILGVGQYVWHTHAHMFFFVRYRRESEHGPRG